MLSPLVAHNQAGTELAGVSGGFTSLGCVTLGAATSSLDMTDSGGMYYAVTGTGQALVQWRANSSAPWSNAVTLSGGGFLSKQGVQVRFVGGTNGFACVRYQLLPGAPAAANSFAPAYVTLSVTARTLNATAALAVNITSVAGVSRDGCIPYWSSEAVNVHWNYGTNGTAPAFWHLTAVSTTATLDERAAIGETLYFKSVSGSGPLVLTIKCPKVP